MPGIRRIAPYGLILVSVFVAIFAIGASLRSDEPDPEGEKVAPSPPPAEASPEARDELSLVDRVRLARGWHSLGELTDPAPDNTFRESDIAYDPDTGLYHVFSTSPDNGHTVHRSAASPEG